MQPNRHHSVRRRAFTLVEVVTTLVVISILASAAVIPAVSMVSRTRLASATDEIARQLSTARSLALSTGDSHGLLLLESTEAFLCVRIQADNAPPTAAIDPLGIPYAYIIIPARYPGVTITSITSGDGSSGDATLWFAHDGTPELRNAAGLRLGSFTHDAVITLSNNATITLRRGTGLIERSMP
jgi:prepilin-type N-terminal cleavage/methylation domain-containing protein